MRLLTSQVHESSVHGDDMWGPVGHEGKWLWLRRNSSFFVDLCTDMAAVLCSAKQIKTYTCVHLCIVYNAVHWSASVSRFWGVVLYRLPKRRNLAKHKKTAEIIMGPKFYTPKRASVFNRITRQTSGRPCCTPALLSYFSALTKKTYLL